MPSMLEKLIETIIKDFEDLEEANDPKAYGKEKSLLLKRIELAKDLASNTPNQLEKLRALEEKLD